MHESNNNMQESSDRPQSSEASPHIKYSKVKRKVLHHVWAVRIFVLLVIMGLFFGIGFGIFKIFENLGLGNVYTLAYNFIKAPAEQVQSAGGRVNILIMGKAGGSHEGPDLTDTMMVASVSLTGQGITIVSIPRDLWIPDIRAKINSAYYWGNQKTPFFDNSGSPGGRIGFAKAITSVVVGQPIQYGVIIDFSAFKDVIDALGGINVKVENSFTDKLYPIAGREDDTCGGDPAFACRYETISFNSGTVVMDGATALKFVRSRHAEGDEGTDLAREARQQKVVNAIKEKISDPKVFLSPKVDLAILDVVKKYIGTDIDLPTAAIIARKGFDSRGSVKQFLIPQDLLLNPPVSSLYDKQYVFIPKAGNGNWADINKWFSEVLK